MIRRTGFTLVETLVVLSAASVLLTLSAVAIQRVMLVHSHARAFHADEATAWRLSSVWRADALRASGATIEKEGSVWLVSLAAEDSRPVSYRFEPAEVTRTAPSSDGTARDTFAFSHALDWRIEQLNATPQRPPKLTVTTHTPDHAGPPLPRLVPQLGVRWTASLGALRAQGAEP